MTMEQNGVEIEVPPSVIDRRAEFAERFRSNRGGAACGEGEPHEPLRLEDDTSNGRGEPERGELSRRGSGTGSTSATLIVPGLLGDSFRSLVAPFLCARTWLDEEGYDVRVAWLNGRRGSTSNAALLSRRVREVAEETGHPVHLVGYSKGATDSLRMIVDHPEIEPLVRSFVSLAGVIRGTPLADSASRWSKWALRYLPLPGLGFGDGQAIADLSRSALADWWEDRELPEAVHYASVLAVPEPHRVSRVLKGGWRRLARFDPRNDSQVLAPDSLLPTGELLAVLNADHWAAALPIEERMPRIARYLVTRNSFPRGALLKSIIDHLETS